MTRPTPPRNHAKIHPGRDRFMSARLFAHVRPYTIVLHVYPYD